MISEASEVLALGSSVVVALGTLALGVQKLLTMRKSDLVTNTGLSLYADQFAAVQKQLNDLRKEQAETSHTIHRQQVRITRTHSLLVLFKGLLMQANIALSSHAMIELTALEMEDAR